MSKYIIDTGDYLFTTDGVLVVGFDCDNKPATFYNSLDTLEELNSDYINEHYGELQDEAYKRGYADAERIWRAPSSDNEFYQKGLEDAWEAAKKIVVDTDHGGIAMGTLCEIFDTRNYSFIMRENTAQEAIAKLKAYEDGNHSDRIEVGDEVISDTGAKFTVTGLANPDNACGISARGFWCFNTIDKLTKTGKHYDIQSILEAMKEC